MSEELEILAEKTAISNGYYQSDREIIETTPWTQHNIYCKGFTEGYNQAAAEIMKLMQRWVSVEDALPERYQDCLFVVRSGDPSYNRRVLGGTYTGDPNYSHELLRNEFSVPGCSFSASHWMPSPISPLTPQNRLTNE